ncbi:MAG: dihydroxy-acid dehydratase, partial [Usitatibacteraceae bacterium]
DVTTGTGQSLSRYTEEPTLESESAVWRASPAKSGDESVLRTAVAPFSVDGGLRLLDGNLGRAVIKVSAVKVAHRIIEAPAIMFNDQNDVLESFKRGELQRDFVAVVRFQGPRANGMPELHKLTPALGSLQDAGFQVALVTDGRMSGASGKVPAAIHVSPECLAGGPLAKVRDGDIIRLDADAGTLQALVSEAEWAQRVPSTADLTHNQFGMGRELFQSARAVALTAEEGAGIFGTIVEATDEIVSEPVLTGAKA